ncbi:MAG: hypothetical protein DMG67_14240 [Acidobacteria bacterium]|nr:MAG: hypothetical protein DMG67_14240 [Acidobacteriota bacterium]
MEHFKGCNKVNRRKIPRIHKESIPMHSALKYKVMAALAAIAVVLVLSVSSVEAAKKKAKAIPSKGPFTLDLLTWYGFFDNSPPGTIIAHPVLHSHAGGKGTFADPITFAVAPQVQKVMKPGKKMYIGPPIQDYFIVEDDCTSSGPGGVPVQGVGCDGELKAGINEFDGWIGATKKDSNSKMTACEDKLTISNIKVIIDPPDGLPVNTTPIFAKNKCNR